MAWFPWRRKARERDLDEEIAFDLAAEAEENYRAGMSREQAERRSRRDFGNLTLAKEATRAMWGWGWWERLAQDGKYGLRLLGRNRGFTAVAVLSLALGIGANTAIYSFMDAILLRALPVPDAQSLVTLEWHARDQPAIIQAFKGGGYRSPLTGFTSNALPYRAAELLAASPVLARTFAFTGAGRLNVQVQRQAGLAAAQYVSGGFFSGLGLAPAFGRLIDAADDRPGAPPVAVLSYRYAARRFGDGARAAGGKILVDNQPFLVVGVAPPEFFGVDPGTPQDLYLPLHASLLFDPMFGGRPDEPFVNPHYYWVQAMARLRPGISRRQAEAALAPLFHHFAQSTASTAAQRADLPALLLADGAGGLDYLRRRYSKPLYMLMAMSGLILALACANIANLLLARAAGRGREMAVRLSVGASRPRVVRQLLTESVLLSLAGGLAGVVLARWGIRGLTLLLAGSRGDATPSATLNWHVLAVTVAISLATGLLFGLAPALAATRVDLVPALKQVGSGVRRLPLHRWFRFSPGQALTVVQMAISLLLVVGGGLFVHTLANLHAVDLGFQQQHLLLFTLNARQAGYTSGQAVRFFDGLQDRFRAIPGVRAASASNFALASGGMSCGGISVPGYSGSRRSACHMNVAPGFFSTMETPILVGREILAGDLYSPSPVAVVNEVFAKTFFPGRNPVGRRFDYGSRKNIEIVGVAKNTRYQNLKSDLPPVAFLCYAQSPNVGTMTYELRAAGDPLGLAGAVRDIVRQADSRIPVEDLLTQEQQIDSTISEERTFAMLCSCFAVLAITIACVGIYGTMAYNVARRTNEIGIRMALGAARPRLLRMVHGEALLLCAGGLAAGIPLAFAGSRLVESFLFRMQARDPLTLSLAPALLLAAALAASYGPAWRASHIDPWSALRDE